MEEYIPLLYRLFYVINIVLLAFIACDLVRVVAMQGQGWKTMTRSGLLISRGEKDWARVALKLGWNNINGSSMLI